jgi:hypothetical protein
MRLIRHWPSANPVDEMRTTVHLSTGQVVFQKLSPLDWFQPLGFRTWFGMKQVLEEKGENGVLHTPSAALLLATTLK